MSFPQIIRPGASMDSRRAFLRRSTSIAVAVGATAVATRSRAGEIAKPQLTSTDQRDAYNADVTNFTAIQGHENAHVAQLVSALGANARPMPTFQNLGQRKARYFTGVAQALENTGVGAYLGALPYIQSQAYVMAAGSIALIEARHAGYLNAMLADPITANINDLTADNDFETPLTVAEVVAAASPFIADLNGGPALTFSTTPSASNDIAILNFALALEYLEAAFYNINVPAYFPSNNT